MTQQIVANQATVRAPRAVVVFDLFGVLARPQDPKGRRTLEHLLEADRPAHFWRSYWSHRPAYDRGECSATQYWTRIGNDIDRPTTQPLINRLVTTDVTSWSRIDHAMVTFAQDLRSRGRRLALLSNAPVEIASHMRDQQPWLKDFEAVVFSCDVAAAKPEPAAFHALEQALNPHPTSRPLLIDDRAENITAARTHGWGGITYTDIASLTTAPALVST